MSEPESSARASPRWATRAEQISDAFGLVLLLVLATYALLSLIDDRGWDAVLLAAVTGTTSVVALVSSHAKSGAVRAALAFSTLGIALVAVAALSGAHLWLNLGSLVEICLLAAAMLAVLRRVVTSAEIGFRTILGALSVYATLGILFTYVYATVDRLQSGPFFEGVAQPESSDFVFFSYTTLTTTGYGDLVPAAQPGQMLAGLEMMVGQIFLVTLVAGLVSLWRPGESLRRRHAKREEG